MSAKHGLYTINRKAVSILKMRLFYLMNEHQVHHRLKLFFSEDDLSRISEFGSCGLTVANFPRNTPGANLRVVKLGGVSLTIPNIARQMKPEDNPYTPGAGTPPTELAGRDDVLNQAKNAIKRAGNKKLAKSLMLLGLRGVGKTVLLNKIEEIAEDEGCETAIFEAAPDRSLPEMLTPQLHRLLLKLNRREAAGANLKKAFEALQGFASIFKVSFQGIDFSVKEAKATGDLSIDLSDLLSYVGEAAATRQTVAVILIDEVQYVRREDLSALIMALHKISQRKLPLLFFGAGLPQLARLAGEAKSYAERLFLYPEIDRLDFESATRALRKPATDEGVTYEDEAVAIILEETQGYPFFLQAWGYHAWEIAPESPITAGHARQATRLATIELDRGFFKVRLDRLTQRQQEYVRAMAEIGDRLATSTEVADMLGISVKQAAPIRDEVIKKGMAYSPQRGRIAFTVPKFGSFLRRAIPDFPAHSSDVGA